MGIEGISTIFSLLDEELNKVEAELAKPNKRGFRRRARYLWNEDYLKELAQQIRDQRSSISFLLDCVKLNYNAGPSDVPRISSAAQTTLRRNYTKAKSFRSQQSSTSLRDDARIEGLAYQIDQTESLREELFNSEVYINARMRCGHQAEADIVSKPNAVSSVRPMPSDMSLKDNFCDRSTEAMEDKSDLQNPQVNNEKHFETSKEEMLLLEKIFTQQLPSRMLSLYVTEEGETADVEKWSSVTAPNIELHITIVQGNVSKAKMLLAKGLDIHSSANLTEKLRPITPLVRAVLGNHAEIVRLLLNNGAEVDQNFQGHTPLHLATASNYSTIAEELLQSGADTTKTVTSNGWTALYIACSSGFLNLTELLLKGKEITSLEMLSKSGYTPLLQAASNGNEKIVKLLLEAGSNVKSKVQERTALHIAAEAGFVSVAKLLIKHGAKLDANDSKSQKPLHLAATYGRHEIIKLLLDSGASFNATTTNGTTALMQAARYNDTTSMELLLEKGANTNLSNVDGLTVTHISARHGSCNALELLLSRAVDLEETDSHGYTPLIFAAERGHVEMVKNLLQANVRVDHIRDDGSTALHIAAKNGHKTVCEALLDHGAAVDYRGKMMLTPLILAGLGNHVTVIKLLLFREADINAQSKQGNSALHAAAQEGNIEAIEVLLDNGAFVNIEAETGDTPLHYAALYGYLESVDLLLRRGSNRSAKVNNSVWKGTPEQVARKRGFQDIADLIKNFRDS
ncbi:hypothetical protein EG329_003211 [Mollisiaceae sp. DMI_Dod_QoI]|nr:hypothetical protein EG329_003211 [Helotiales sp. DMI_Dod_QoI]